MIISGILLTPMETVEDVLGEASKFLPMSTRMFRDCFGVDPCVVCKVYDDYLCEGTSIRDLLLYLHYTKCYPLVMVGAGTWRMHHNTHQSVLNRVREERNSWTTWSPMSFTGALSPTLI